MQYRLAYRPDPPSPRDRSFQDAAPVLAAKLGKQGDHHIPEYTPISNQGGAGTCAANACGDGLEIVHGVIRTIQEPTKPYQAKMQISRRHIYWLARSLDGSLDRDDGTYIRSCLQQMRNIGVCDEKYMPYDDKRIFQPPSLEAKVRASENKITGFFRIDESKRARLDAIATAVRANHPVVFGTTVGSNLQNYTAGANPLTPITSGERGGHAMLVTGVITVAGRYRFLVRNSWGRSWGDGGYCWFDEDYMLWSETRDLWMLTLMKELL